MLDKRLNIGGLQVGGPRTAQNPSRFRVANNVYQTLDDYMVPRFHGNEFLAPATFAGKTKVVGTARYLDEVFTMAMDGSNIYYFYKADGTLAPTYNNLALKQIDWGANNALLPSGPQFVEKLGCLFIGLPSNNLIKFDGYQVYRAGVPLPRFSCAQYASAGATFVRVIGHHIDLQGNVVNSGYVEFPATPAANLINIRTDKNATDIIGNTNVSPTVRPTWENFDGGFDEFYHVGSGSVAGANTVVVTTGGNHSVKVDAYVLVSADLLNTASNGLPSSSYAIALKVKSFNATTVTYDLNDAKYLDTNREWQTGNVNNTAVFLGSMVEGTNYYISIWTSTSSTGAYVWKGIQPNFYNSTVNNTQSTNVASPTVAASGSTDTAYNLAPILGDIYDVTSFKGLFPRLNNASIVESCFSTYGDVALLSYKNEIFFSDTTLGGAFEMTNGLAFIVVGEGDDGFIQSVCGNSDFMFVSRQFKNYYLVGSLPTANYRVQEISETSLGVYSNESSIAVVDKIIFFNKQGIWALYSGGRCENIAFNIKGLFENFSNTTVFDEESYFNISAFPTYAKDVVGAVSPDPGVDYWIRLRLDVNRNLLFFVIHGDGGGQILILNLNNGEFYTWNGMLEDYPGSGTKDIKDFCVIDGYYYLTMNHGSTIAVYKENKVIPRIPYDYMGGAYNPRLKTTWFVAGEPSLEKKFTQLKMWGIIQGTCSISHALDWSQSTSVDDGGYVVGTSDAQKFSHKKRLDTANALAISVDIEFEGDRLEIEGMEIEFGPFQEGMKR